MGGVMTKGDPVMKIILFFIALFLGILAMKPSTGVRSAFAEDSRRAFQNLKYIGPSGGSIALLDVETGEIYACGLRSKGAKCLPRGKMRFKLNK